MSIPDGDYEKGKKLFKTRCLQCHVIDSDANKNGPTLKGIFGRKSGTVDSYTYSQANKNKVSVFLYSITSFCSTNIIHYKYCFSLVLVMIISIKDNITLGHIYFRGIGLSSKCVSDVIVAVQAHKLTPHL